MSQPSNLAPSVEYVYLSGNSGLKVSNICLGGGPFGEGWDWHPTGMLGEADSHKILDRFVELGGNFVDTANSYAKGKSEEIIGSWLSKRCREELVITSKCRIALGTNGVERFQNDAGLSRKSILRCIDESLKRLKTNYIDLYQTHCWDAGTPLKETMLTLNDLVRAGKVRYIGCSNLSGWQIQKCADFAEFLGLSPFVTLQQQYNLWDRSSEIEAFEVCKNEGIGILAFSPLKTGLLTGKYKRGIAPPADSRGAWADTLDKPSWEASQPFSKYANNEAYWSIRDATDKIAASRGKSAAQIALRWVLQKEGVTSAIVGTHTVKTLEENMEAGKGWRLTDEEMKELDEASANANTFKYPYTMMFRLNEGRKHPNCPLGRQL